MTSKALHKLEILQAQLNSVLQELVALKKELKDSGASTSSARKGLTPEDYAKLDEKFNRRRGIKKAE